MQSPARNRLKCKFFELPVGQQFHMVNTVMGGAIPGSPTLEKIPGEYQDSLVLTANAKYADNGTKVLIRESADVELI